MTTRVRLSRAVAGISLLVLVLVQVVQSVSDQAPWIVWLARLMPLLLFVPGMLRDHLRSYLWLCFVTLLYFVGAVLRLFAVPGDALALSGLLSVVSLFLAAMLYVRWRARELRGMSVDE